MDFNYTQLKKPLGLFKRAFSEYKNQFLIITILGFLGGLAGGIGIGAIIPLFSFITDRKDLGANFVSRVVGKLFASFNFEYNIVLILGLIIILFILKAAFIFFANYINAKIAANYEYKTRKRLFQNTIYASWPYLMQQKIGYLEKVLIEDIYQSTHILLYLSSIILMSTSLIMYAFVAINISVPIALLTLGLGGIILISLKPFFSKAKKFGEQMTKTYKIAANYINEQNIGAKTIKALRAEQKVAQKGNEVFQKLKDIRIKMAVYNVFSGTLIEPLGLIFIAVLFGLTYNSPTFNIASFAAIIYLIQKIFTFTNSIQGHLHSISQIVPNLETVLSYQDMALKNREKSLGLRPYSFKKYLQFANIKFGYNSKGEILKDVNFTIKKGGMLGLIGSSGSGKTTIVDLLSRFFEPSKGKILLDGIDISAINIKDWRENLGYVSQDPFLINDTIENNIKFYDESILQKQIVEAAKMANIYDFIMEQPLKFQTMVGERGVFLSVGQRQRIILARILSRDPDILILDEATSALDNESEAMIQKTIENLKGRMTVITIAHRLSTIMNCDWLFVLNNGKIIEQGSPKDLLKNRSSYFRKVYKIGPKNG